MSTENPTLDVVDSDPIDEVVAEDPELVRLPVGIAVDDGERIDYVKLRELTGRDRNRYFNPKIVKNGGKMTTEFVHCSLAEIGGYSHPDIPLELVRKMSVADRDYLFYKSRMLSFGNTLEMDVQCSNVLCDATLNVPLDLSTLEVLYLNPDETRNIHIELPKGFRGNKVILCSHPSGEDTEKYYRIARSNPHQYRLILIWKNIVEFGDIEIKKLRWQDLEDMYERDLSVIDDYLTGSKAPGIRTRVHIDCEECGTTFETPIDMTNFFSVAHT